MAKTYKSWDEFQKAFSSNSKKLIKDMGKSMPAIGKEMIDMIQNRTRLGYGVEKNGGTKKKLTKLSGVYKKQRNYAKKQGKLSNTTKPSKSNLTKSGAMLSSLKYKVNKSKLLVKVAPTGIDADGISNAKKAEWQATAKVVRKFLHLSKNEIKRIEELLEDELDKLVRKLI